jgi:hypothetical protein
MTINGRTAAITLGIFAVAALVLTGKAEVSDLEKVLGTFATAAAIPVALGNILKSLKKDWIVISDGDEDLALAVGALALLFLALSFLVKTFG